MPRKIRILDETEPVDLDDDLEAEYDIEEDLINKLAAIAKQEQMPAETLVNKWLGEKVAGYPEARP
jgi:hypothetical protein